MRPDGPVFDFDGDAGREARADGIARVEAHGAGFVARMREVARIVSQQNGQVTVDDLRFYARECGIKPHHRNAWGAIFRGPHWAPIGHTKSVLASNHARTIRVWTFQEKGQKALRHESRRRKMEAR